MSFKEPGRGGERIAKLKAVKSPRLAAGPFSDLTWEQQRAAEQWLWKFCKRWEGNLPNWRRGILVGVARRLAVNPPPDNFARSLNGHVGARILACRVRRAGIPHPGTSAMHRASVWKRAGKPILPAYQFAI